MSDKMMRFACLTKKGTAEVRERPLPEIGDFDVLLEMKACNICTTDYQQWLGLREHQGYPMAGGHEAAGIVARTGAKVRDFKPGDLVATGYAGCGFCDACRRGEVDQCAEMKQDSEDGYKWGHFGFSNLCVKKINGLYKIKSGIRPSEAAFLEPLATVIHGAKKLRLQPFETVAVIGAGTMGLINAQVARAFGAKALVSEMMEKKLKTAEAMGFETVDCGKEDPVKAVMDMTEGKGADAVIVAVGSTLANQQALEMLKEKDGRILLFAAGYPAPEMDVDSNQIHYRRTEIIGTFGADNADFIQAAKALSTGMADVSMLVEKKTFTLDEIQEAYREASKPGMYRVSVLLDQ